ncbi:GNAT family N-acetyltransferase [Halobacteriales archaeon Cl-PHB]
MDIDVPDTGRVDDIVERWVDLATDQRSHGSHVLPAANRTSIREDVLRHAVSESLLVAREDDKVRGFVMFALESGVYDQDVTRGVIENLFVDPDHRQAGIGAELLSAAEEALVERGADVVALEVLADNAEARRFYREHDYEPHRIEMERALESDTLSRDDE